MRPALLAFSLFVITGWWLSTTSSIDGQETRPDPKPSAAKTDDSTADPKKPAEKIAKPEGTKPTEPVAKPEPKTPEIDSIKIPNVKPREKLAPKPAEAKPANKKPVDPMITPEREAAAMAFANRHHPELAALLTALSTRNPAQYENALRDLYKASERLAQVHERDPERYDLDLADWKVSSRVQMLAARLSVGNVGPQQAVQDELKQVLGEQADLRIKLLKLERDRAAQRQAKAEELLEAAQSGRDAEVQRRLDMFIRGAKKKVADKAAKTAEKAAEKGAEKAPIEAVKQDLPKPAVDKPLDKSTVAKPIEDNSANNPTGQTVPLKKAN